MLIFQCGDEKSLHARAHAAVYMAFMEFIDKAKKDRLLVKKSSRSCGTGAEDDGRFAQGELVPRDAAILQTRTIYIISGMRAAKRSASCACPLLVRCI